MKTKLVTVEQWRNVLVERSREARSREADILRDAIISHVKTDKVSIATLVAEMGVPYRTVLNWFHGEPPDDREVCQIQKYFTKVLYPEDDSAAAGGAQ